MLFRSATAQSEPRPLIHLATAYLQIRLARAAPHPHTTLRPAVLQGSTPSTTSQPNAHKASMEPPRQRLPLSSLLGPLVSSVSLCLSPGSPGLWPLFPFHPPCCRAGLLGSAWKTARATGESPRTGRGHSLAWGREREGWMDAVCAGRNGVGVEGVGGATGQSVGLSTRGQWRDCSITGPYKCPGHLSACPHSKNIVPPNLH